MLFRRLQPDLQECMNSRLRLRFEEAIMRPTQFENSKVAKTPSLELNKDQLCWRASRVVLTAGSVLSRNARKRGSGHACCSCNTGCTGRNRSTPCTSIAFPWFHASCSCHRWYWNDAPLEWKVRCWVGTTGLMFLFVFLLQRNICFDRTCHNLHSKEDTTIHSPVSKSVKRLRHTSHPWWCYLLQRVTSWDVQKLRHKQHVPQAPHPLGSSSLLLLFFRSINWRASFVRQKNVAWNGAKMLMSPALMCVSFKFKTELDGWWLKIRDDLLYPAFFKKNK